MKSYITFFNHSCIELVSPDTRILCDPWFFGSAFGDGWSLLHNKSHDINELSFDYIWISHEHPDHFSIPTLSSLQKPTNFLYQKTKDQKVKRFLENKGHTVIELEHKTPTKIGDLELTCVLCDGYDSSLVIKFPNGRVVVNINDARIDQNNHLESELMPVLKNLDVDLMLFQFSYANWAGNQGDNRIPRHQQELTDKKIHFAIEKLKPKMIMPFASFVYFSHEENFYWNEHTWLGHVISTYSKLNCQFILPRPNQKLSLDPPAPEELQKSNQAAKIFWDEKFSYIRIRKRTNSVLSDSLRHEYEHFLEKLHNTNPLLQKIETNQDFILHLRITDLNSTVSIGLFQKYFKEQKHEVENVAAQISSETFCFLMKNAFGRGTVTINGRIQFNYDHAHKFFLYFFVFYANNIGITFNQFSVVTSAMLHSVANTSVMTSILQCNEKARENIKLDIEYLAGIFREVSEADLEMFNEEPPNDHI